MPVILKTGRSQNMNSTMHYVATGNYNVKNGNINQPKPTAQNGIKYRNYLMEGHNSSGLDSPESLILPTGTKHSYQQYKRGQRDNKWWLNQDRVKNQSVNLVMSFGHELDWRNPNDLMCGRWIVNHFLHSAFPTQSAFVGYQMDNAGRQSHVHLIINSIDQDKIESTIRNGHFDNKRLYYYEEKVTKQWNQMHPEKHIKRFGELEQEQNHIGRTRKRIITRASHLIPNVHRFATDFIYMNNHAHQNGLVMNGYQHGEKLPLRELKYPDRVDGYTLQLPRSKNRNLQSKPIRLGGSYLNEYVPGARVEDIKKDMHVNQQQAIDINNATIDLEQIHNSNVNHTNNIIAHSRSKISSASSSAFIASFKNHIKSSSLAHSLNYSIPLAKAQTHNMQIETKHHKYGKQIKLQQRHQALDSLRQDDIIRHSHLQPNTSFASTVDLISDLHHTFTNSLHSLGSIINQNKATQSLSQHQSVLASLQSRGDDFELTEAHHNYENSSNDEKEYEEEYNQEQINRVDRLYNQEINRQQSQVAHQQLLNSLYDSYNNSNAETKLDSLLALSSSSASPSYSSPFVAIPKPNFHFSSISSINSNSIPAHHVHHIQTKIDNHTNQIKLTPNKEHQIDNHSTNPFASMMSTHNSTSSINPSSSSNLINIDSYSVDSSIISFNSINGKSNSNLVSHNSISHSSSINSISSSSDSINSSLSSNNLSSSNKSKSISGISNRSSVSVGSSSNAVSNSSSKISSSKADFIKFSNEMKNWKMKSKANDRKWNKANGRIMKRHFNTEKKVENKPSYKIKTEIENTNDKQAKSYGDKIIKQINTIPRLSKYFNNIVGSSQLNTYRRNITGDFMHKRALVLHRIYSGYQDKYGQRDAKELEKQQYQKYIEKHHKQMENYEKQVKSLGYGDKEAREKASVHLMDSYTTDKKNNREYGYNDLKPASYREEEVDEITFRDESGSRIGKTYRPIMNTPIKHDYTVFEFKPHNPKVQQAKDDLLNKADKAVEDNQQNQKQVINKIVDSSKFNNQVGSNLVNAHMENRNYHLAVQTHNRVVRDYNRQLSEWKHGLHMKQIQYGKGGADWQ